MKGKELEEHIKWLQHQELQIYLQSPHAHTPWFPAYKSERKENYSITWFSALVPPRLVPNLCQNNVSWDLKLGDGSPSIQTYYEGGKSHCVYDPFGNRDGIEPLALYRTFHGLRGKFVEVTQEFKLFHNLYPESTQNRFLVFDLDGNEAEAIRYGMDFVEIRTDLLLRFCSAKQMALAVYVESFRHSKLSLGKMGQETTHAPYTGKFFIYQSTVMPTDRTFDEEFETFGRLIGKKYIMPGQMPSNDHAKRSKTYQEFIIGTDDYGNTIKHTCNQEQLANYFGANPGAPHYLTPVFFRADVLSKYHADPQKYSVEDGYLRCGGLWGLRMDNDHTDYVVVWLGDLGRDLSESERSYWINFNIPPHGRRISQTNFKRAFLAEGTDPSRPDFLFKYAYSDFCKLFRKIQGWDFFRPLHPDDKHFFTSLHLPGKDNQAEFDTQLIALTKILIDSLNESKISENLKTLKKNDKGITKLEKYFIENKMTGHEKHMRFLRILQDLRSKSAVHRKGGNYDQLVKKLNLKGMGPQKVFEVLLSASVVFMFFLKSTLSPAKTRRKPPRPQRH